ncbi:MAG: glycine C-acetyltransferase, partial [Spirochaetota bacterium]
MYSGAQQIFAQRLASITEEGLWKSERRISTPQGTHITAAGRENVLNMCANNYLGLASHPEIIAAAKENLDRYGYGLSSVRFICGTQDIHLELERQLSAFLGTDDTILYSSCYDANGGLFESLLGPEDAVISDELNHASIIDGVRLCKARRFRYKNSDMADLERQLRAASSARLRLVVSDGVFSMDGIIARLKDICDLAERYEALVMVDDSHAVGFIGEQGRGSHEFCSVMGRVDIITGTLGKALGGASGGYTSARGEIVALLRQVSRPYLFSNSLAPVIAATSLAVLQLVRNGGALRERLRENMALFARRMREEGFDVPCAEHPIIPVMFYDAHLANRIAEKLLEQGVYAIGFT